MHQLLQVFLRIGEDNFCLCQKPRCSPGRQCPARQDQQSKGFRGSSSSRPLSKMLLFGAQAQSLLLSKQGTGRKDRAEGFREQSILGWTKCSEYLRACLLYISKTAIFTYFFLNYIFQTPTEALSIQAA